MEAHDARYADETETKYGTRVSASAPQANNDENKFSKDELMHRPDTPTFKPLGANIYQITREDVTPGTEAAIVFETRHADHPLSQMAVFTEGRQIPTTKLLPPLTEKHRARTEKRPDLSQTPTLLQNLQTPYYAFTPRQRK